MTVGTETPPTSPASSPSRLGPFEILGRMTGQASAGVVTLSVRGAADGEHAGRDGVVECFTAPADEEKRERLRSILASLVALDHPAIAAPIHAALTGDIAYVVNPVPPSDGRGPSATGGVMTPSRVAELLPSISAALEAAHQLGLSHGNLSRETVAMGDDGPVIGGWSVFGRGPAGDQRGLALLIVDWLAGSPFDEPADPEGSANDEQRRERLRQHLETVTERVVFVLARASRPVPEDRYPSVAELVSAFQEAVARSGEELVHGGFEAISARSPELAQFLVRSAERYDPYAPGLDLLRTQLAASGVPTVTSGMPQLAAGLAFAPVSGISPTSPPPTVMAGLDPALTEGIPQELLTMIAPPMPTPARPRNNPWLVMLLGVAGLCLLLLVGAAIMFFAGSS